MKVSFAPLAANDLAGIRLYLDETGSLHADALIKRILAACHKLADFPHRGLGWKLSSGRMVRRIAVDGYLVVYEVGDACVQILRILHGHRDLRDIFRLDDDDGS